MYYPMIDAHIHLDKYERDERQIMLQDMDKYKVEALIAVSEHLTSAQKNVSMARKDKRIKPAFGWHPEQVLPTDNEIAEIQIFGARYQDEMIAVGEVGLPYYLRKKNPEVTLEPYVEILELFIKQAAQLGKPIVLHAIYEDASIVCDLLEKHALSKAHFHWFKGDGHTIERMIQNGYFISVTPDVVYEKEIQGLVEVYPLSHIMVETDGPWPFVGPFEDDQTHPGMMHDAIRQVASIKRMDLAEVCRVIYENTKWFYDL